MKPKHLFPVLLLAATLVGAGCGGDGGDDDGGGGATTPPAQTSAPSTSGGGGTRARTTAPAVDGAQVFASAGCGSCHTLSAADARGVTGPNLDDLQPSLEQVKTQVENGGGGMPSYSGDLSPEEIDAVAVYVSENAGR